jgi:hypothetical protein
MDVVVGDAGGADSEVQRFFAKLGYGNVTVFASDGRARNNHGRWEVEYVSVDRGVKGFDYYKVKDEAMTRVADCGYMIWDGASKGTLRDIIHLIGLRKTCSVYLTEERRNITLCDDDDLAGLMHNRKLNVSAAYEELYAVRNAEFSQVAFV